MKATTRNAWMLTSEQIQFDQLPDRTIHGKWYIIAKCISTDSPARHPTGHSDHHHNCESEHSSYVQIAQQRLIIQLLRHICQVQIDHRLNEHAHKSGQPIEMLTQLHLVKHPINIDYSICFRCFIYLVEHITLNLHIWLMSSKGSFSIREI